MQVLSQGQQNVELIVPVEAADPGIFTQDASGVGPGAILNQDSTVNTPFNPAARGSTVVLFATGSGLTTPSSIEGQVSTEPLPKSVLPVFVQIGGFDAEVLYAGAAPGLLAGILQVDCLVPANVASGYSVPVVLTVGAAISQAGVTVAIQ